MLHPTKLGIFMGLPLLQFGLMVRKQKKRQSKCPGVSLIKKISLFFDDSEVLTAFCGLNANDIHTGRQFFNAAALKHDACFS